ncbi:MAG: hypothetical protein ABI359_06605 [Ginsengibacter sp.]
MPAKNSAYQIAMLSARAALIGALMIGISFAINPGPPDGATSEQLILFGKRYYKEILWGGWLQAVGPVLIMLFAISIVYLAAAMNQVVGWMTLLGACILVMVSLTEVIFYITALFSVPDNMDIVSMNIAHAVQHLYFIVAAPAIFLPLGLVVLSSTVLPKVFGYLAIGLAIGFMIVGITSLYHLVLSTTETLLAPIQAFWWVGAAITLRIRAKKRYLIT